ncbi:8-oxo-dGDP phosphatase NUDT18 [Anopheles ziemanni]|uniref:8-oxo-dGDP phosphatase NUDT18 n=1 Tax=Anopheles coustani TaxID=139045 RepID=UPI002659E1CE|nr:8-oxo-dGDP phosphatase NUDT18 [Anopheles coustani]XP_058172343.1 8-oxo-dGDP phosphatase NUDT18 [Anopheles ziemanni]
METNLVRVLEGQYLDELTSELCDFTLEEQNAATEAQGVKPLAASDYVPIVGKTVTYVVACVIVNDANEVLMMQEAKESCAGKWYLPAGRMEPGETIMEAGAREVLEETGLKVEITTLLAVETAGGSWFRFVLTGNVIGGELKTPSQADQESIQAKWCQNLNELSLRANDILPIVELARNYRVRSPKDPNWHREILPARKAHYKNYLRVVVAIKNKSTNQVYVLLSEKTAYHFPTVEIHPGRSIHSTLKKFMIELFGADLPQHRPHGVLSVEHHTSGTQANPTDGMCLTVLVICRPSIESVSLIGKCIWHELSKDLSARLAMAVAGKNATFQLHVVR